MALSDVFLTPSGLAALLLAVPIVVLYLVRPDPRRVELPTFRFLAEERREDASNPLFERLRRSVLLLVQLLAVLLFATALATPYVPVSEASTVEETVFVVDASASMGVQSDGTTRFARAVDAARGEVTGTASVVVADGQSTVALRRGDADEARTVLADLSVTDSSGDLRSAISTVTAVVGSDARVVVVSDFLVDPEEVAEAVAALGDSDVLLVRVLAPDELDPDATGDTVFEDPESRDTRRSYFGGSAARRYRRRLERHTDDVAERARDLRADHALLDTGADYFEAFSAVWVG